MSLTLKLLSLAIRTIAKPIANNIKRQAKEHDGFRRFAIHQAQRVHRIDMRMRLGILHDPIAQERMHERELKAAEEKRRKAEAPTVRTEEEQKKYEERKEREEKAEREGRKKEEKSGKIKIRPLSEAKAIELGANFFSEAFVFMVAAGLIVFENWRSRRKESTRRDEIKERVAVLETEVEKLRYEHNLPELEALNQRIQRTKEEQEMAKAGWWNMLRFWRKTGPDSAKDEDDGVPGEVEALGKSKQGLTDSLKSVLNAPRPGMESASTSGAKTEQEDKTKREGRDGKSAATEPERIDVVKATAKER